MRRYGNGKCQYCNYHVVGSNGKSGVNGHLIAFFKRTNTFQVFWRSFLDSSSETASGTLMPVCWFIVTVTLHSEM